jgi:hypothetical protein
MKSTTPEKVMLWSPVKKTTFCQIMPTQEKVKKSKKIEFLAKK